MVSTKVLFSKFHVGKKGYNVPKQTRRDVLKPNLPSYDVVVFALVSFNGPASLQILKLEHLHCSSSAVHQSHWYCPRLDLPIITTAI